MQQSLTPREWQVFELIVHEGLTNREIGERLGITERVVKFHSTNVLHKMRAPDRLKMTVSYWQALVEEVCGMQAAELARAST